MKPMMATGPEGFLMSARPRNQDNQIPSFPRSAAHDMSRDRGSASRSGCDRRNR
jgi:hypothetical protein